MAGMFSPQELPPRLRCRHKQSADIMRADILARKGLDLLIDSASVSLQPCNIGIAIDRVKTARSVPVDSLRSISATSVQPCFVRWYKTLQPITPPPIIAPRIFCGTDCSFLASTCGTEGSLRLSKED